MKKIVSNTRVLLVFSLLILTICTICFADTVTQQKTVLTYNEDTRTLDLDFYISKGTAIVGYCSFDYDSSVLTLIDSSKNALPSQIPADNTFISKVVSGKNGVEITAVNKGSDKLIDNVDGHLFFAWFLPSSIPCIDATKGEVLIATASFKLNESKSKDDIKNDSVKVADSTLTSKVPGWFEGLVVLDKNQTRFTYDGKTQGTALYTQSLILDKAATDANKDENTENVPDNNESTTDEPQNNNSNDTSDGNTNEDEAHPSDNDSNSTDNTQGEENTGVTENTENADGAESTDNTESTDTTAPDSSGDTAGGDNTPIVSDKSDIEIIGNAKIAKEGSFSLEVTPAVSTLKIKWHTPAGQDTIVSYTIFVCDSNYNTVKVISGISGVSTSYTLSDVASDFDYNIYVIATLTGEEYFSSDVVKAKTLSEGAVPTTIVSNVFYDSGAGNLYGLSSELVLFGGTPTKVPTVIAPVGKRFVGWSTDEKTLIDVSSTCIYSDTTFFAVYSTASAKYKGYISGYPDGTFNPDGNITRAEAATIISRITDDYDKDITYTHSFTDVEEGFWYENAVAYCQQKGYIKGYEDGTFAPYGNITRAEFATILVRVFGFDGTLGINVFSDISEHWGKNAVSILYGAGIACPDKDGLFRPDERLTRSDAVLMLNPCLEIIPDRQSIIENAKEDGYKFTDVAQYEDYFFDIYASLMN